MPRSGPPRQPAVGAADPAGGGSEAREAGQSRSDNRTRVGFVVATASVTSTPSMARTSTVLVAGLPSAQGAVAACLTAPTRVGVVVSSPRPPTYRAPSITMTSAHDPAEDVPPQPANSSATMSISVNPDDLSAAWP